MAAEVEWVKDPDGGFGRIQMMLMFRMMMVLKQSSSKIYIPKTLSYQENFLLMQT